MSDLELRFLIHKADEMLKPLDISVSKERAIFYSFQAIIDALREIAGRLSEIEGNSSSSIYNSDDSI